MRSSSGGLLTTLLMFVPLIAVPALAIFGVPNAGGLKGSIDADATSPPLDLDADSSLGAAVKSPGRISADDSDGFLPTDHDALGSGPLHDPFLEVSSHLNKDRGSARSHDSPRDSRNVLDGKPGRPPRTAANEPARLAADDPAPDFGDPADSAGFGRPPADRKTANPEAGESPNVGSGGLRRTAENGRPAEAAPLADLRSAIRRLKELGITEYQLLPGEAANGFLFTCQCPSADNPRITHRFEAEAAEPLEAVRDVLNQIESRLRGQ